MATATEETKQPRAELRTIQGVVASDKGNKTIKVVVEYQTKHRSTASTSSAHHAARAR
jgi:ribosomal protein S17